MRTWKACLAAAAVSNFRSIHGDGANFHVREAAPYDRLESGAEIAHGPAPASAVGHKAGMINRNADFQSPGTGEP